MFFEQTNRRDHHSGRADATLRAAIFDERLLHRVQLIFTRRNSFDCLDRRARYLCDGDETTVDNPSVDHHRARATLTFTAPFFCSGQGELLTQDVQQPLHRKRLHRLRATVDDEFDFSFFSQGICL